MASSRAPRELERAEVLHTRSRRLRLASAMAWAGAVGVFLVRQYATYGPWAALITAVLAVLAAPIFVAIARRPDDGLRNLTLVLVIFAWSTLISIAVVPFAHGPDSGTNTLASRNTAVGTAVLCAVVTFCLALYTGGRYLKHGRDDRAAVDRRAGR